MVVAYVALVLCGLFSMLTLVTWMKADFDSGPLILGKALSFLATAMIIPSIQKQLYIDSLLYACGGVLVNSALICIALARERSRARR